MKKATVTIGIVLALIGALILLVPSDSDEDRRIQATIAADKQREQQPEHTRATPDELFALVNEERVKAGVPPLALDERLNESAQRKADDMAKYQYNEHVSPTDGRNGYEYAYETGVNCAYVSENLFSGGGRYIQSQEAIHGWMQSTKGHREAILDAKYTLTGIGIAQDTDKILYQVQHFCETL